MASYSLITDEHLALVEDKISKKCKSQGGRVNLAPKVSCKPISKPRSDTSLSVCKGTNADKKIVAASRKKDTVPCSTCSVKFCDDKSGRKWVQCQLLSCLKWYHNECQGLPEKNQQNFICINCDDDSD